MKKVVSMLALVAFLFTAGVNAQEAKSKDKKESSTKEKKECSKDKKGGCCANKKA